MGSGTPRRTRESRTPLGADRHGERARSPSQGSRSKPAALPTISDNLEVLTREEHIAEHHKPDPAREAWRALVAELANS